MGGQGDRTATLALAWMLHAAPDALVRPCVATAPLARGLAIGAEGVRVECGSQSPAVLTDGLSGPWRVWEHTL